MDRHMDHGDRSYRLSLDTAGYNVGGVLYYAGDWQAFVSSDLFSAGAGVYLYPQPGKVSGTSLVLCFDFRDSL